MVLRMRANSWADTIRVDVADTAADHAAYRVARRRVAEVERAARRDLPRAEVHRLYRAAGRTLTVSPLLAAVVAEALDGAQRTAGAVDPTVAACMTWRETAQQRAAGSLGVMQRVLPACGSPTHGGPPAAAGWWSVELDGRRLRVPPGVTLDLTATAAAFAADLAAVTLAIRFGGTARVDVAGHVAVVSAGGIRGRATSTCTTTVVDPFTGHAVRPVWRSVTVVAATTVIANAHSLAAFVHGREAPAALRSAGVAAHLVARDRRETWIGDADDLPARARDGGRLRPVAARGSSV